MALTSAERQKKYREQQKVGKLKRFQIVMPLETAKKVDYLTDALQCNKTDLFARLVMDEWERQGQPLPQ